MKIPLRHCKDILDTLGMSGYTHKSDAIKLVENFCVYMLAKNQLDPKCFSGDIAKISKLLISSTLEIPGHPHPK